MKPLHCISVCMLMACYTQMGLAGSKMVFDSQSTTEVRKADKKHVWQQDSMQKDLKKLSKQVESLSKLEQRRAAKEAGGNINAQQNLDDMVRNKIQEIADFVQISSIAVSDPDFSHAILSHLSALNKVRRESLGSTSGGVSAFSANLSYGSSEVPQDKIDEIQDLVNKQESFVNGQAI